VVSGRQNIVGQGTKRKNRVIGVLAPGVGGSRDEDGGKAEKEKVWQKKKA